MFLAKPHVGDYEIIEATSKTLDDLRSSLKLPEQIKLSDADIIDYIDNMKHPDYSTILFLRYVMGYSYRKIEKESNLYYASLQGFCSSAIKTLKKEIMEDLLPSNISNKPISDLIYHKISNNLGLGHKTVYESVEWLLKFDYKPSKSIDMLVQSIGYVDINFIYPKYLLKKPPYPFNLYAQILRGEIGSRGLSVREIQNRYLYRMLENPQYNVSMFIYNVNNIFSDKNSLLSDKDKFILKEYYQKELSVPETSESINIPQSTIKAVIQKALKIFNSKEGLEFIHTGNIN